MNNKGELIPACVGPYRRTWSIHRKISLVGLELLRSSSVSLSLDLLLRSCAGNPSKPTEMRAQRPVQ